MSIHRIFSLSMVKRLVGRSKEGALDKARALALVSWQSCHESWTFLVISVRQGAAFRVCKFRHLLQTGRILQLIVRNDGMKIDGLVTDVDSQFAFYLL
jgi:hypothetical protein